MLGCQEYERNIRRAGLCAAHDRWNQGQMVPLVRQIVPAWIGERVFMRWPADPGAQLCVVYMRPLQFPALEH